MLVNLVLISFREWLHSYRYKDINQLRLRLRRSHLFQRVASFLHYNHLVDLINIYLEVLISFREWLHSYYIILQEIAASKSFCSHLFQRVASFLRRFDIIKVVPVLVIVLISFREWLHSYNMYLFADGWILAIGSHLFQRVASFLQCWNSLRKALKMRGSHLFQRVASFLQ